MLKKRILMAFMVVALLAVYMVKSDTMAAVSDNITFTATVPTIITLAADNHTVAFGTLNIGSVTAPTSGAPVTLTVDSNVNYDIKATGADFSDGATHTFPLTQLQYKVGAGAFADLASGTRIVTNHVLGAATTNVLNFQMKAPSAAYTAGNYSTSVTFTAGIVGF